MGGRNQRGGEIWFSARGVNEKRGPARGKGFLEASGVTTGTERLWDGHCPCGTEGHGSRRRLLVRKSRGKRTRDVGFGSFNTEKPRRWGKMTQEEVVTASTHGLERRGGT